MSLAGMGFDSKCSFAPPTFLLGLFIAVGPGISFFGGIQHSPTDGCSSVSCSFGVLTEEDVCVSFYSIIFPIQDDKYVCISFCSAILPIHLAYP